jgi:hypothetical protein
MPQARPVGAISWGSAVGFPGLMNEQECAASRFGAMSGWVASTPVSRTPTFVPRPR